jgi:hypothetical protein
MAFTEGYHAHQFSPENQQAALDFLDHFNGMPVRHGLPAARTLEDKALLSSKSGQVMLDFQDARSLMDVIRDYYNEQKSSRPRTTVANEYFNHGYVGIKSWKVDEHKGTQPGAGWINWEFAGSTRFKDVAIDRYILHHSGPLQMPLLYIHKASAKKRDALLWFRDNGKAKSEDWPEIEKYLAKDYDVVSFDFRGLGETRMPFKVDSADDPLLAKLDFDQAYTFPLLSVLADYVYNSLLVGRPYFLQMIEDAEIASRFAREKLGTPVTAVTSPGNGYSLAKDISETLPDIALLPQPDGHALSWAEIVRKKQELWPIQFLLPAGAYIH